MAAFTTDASITCLVDLIKAMEAKIMEPPALDVVFTQSLQGTPAMPQQQRATGIWIQREDTVNLTGTVGGLRNQNRSQVEDIIQVVFAKRIRPKDQRQSRNELYEVIDLVRNRLTDLDWRRKNNIVHRDTREELPTGEWMRVTMRLTTKRVETVGGG